MALPLFLSHSTVVRSPCRAGTWRPFKIKWTPNMSGGSKFTTDKIQSFRWRPKPRNIIFVWQGLLRSPSCLYGCDLLKDFRWPGVGEKSLKKPQTLPNQAESWKKISRRINLSARVLVLNNDATLTVHWGALSFSFTTPCWGTSYRHGGHWRHPRHSDSNSHIPQMLSNEHPSFNSIQMEANTN